MGYSSLGLILTNTFHTPEDCFGALSIDKADGGVGTAPQKAGRTATVLVPIPSLWPRVCFNYSATSCRGVCIS